MKRAGLDYWDQLDIHHYDSLEDFLAQHVYFIFGREDTGLPEAFLQDQRSQAIRIPMNDDHVRSLNLSNAVCMVVYEALRQQQFVGLEEVHHYVQDKIK